jgi:hypothetical protein
MRQNSKNRVDTFIIASVGTRVGSRTNGACRIPRAGDFRKSYRSG